MEFSCRALGSRRFGVRAIASDPLSSISTLQPTRRDVRLTGYYCYLRVSSDLRLRRCSALRAPRGWPTTDWQRVPARLVNDAVNFQSSTIAHQFSRTRSEAGYAKRIWLWTCAKPKIPDCLPACLHVASSWITQAPASSLYSLC